MAWQTYVDDQLVATGNVSHGALCGLDGSIWAVSPGWNLTDAEAKAMVDGIKGNTLQASGAHLAGQKYFTLQTTDDGMWIGKQGPGGGCAKCSGTAIVIGIYGEGVTPSACNEAVDRVAQYLTDSGY